MREREKLYIQMEDGSTNLKLNKDKLLLFLKTEENIDEMSFKYNSEFLNILNTIIFFYGCVRIIKQYFYDLALFIFIDLSFIIYIFIYNFIIKHKKINRKELNKIFVMAFIGIILSNFLNVKDCYQSCSLINSSYIVASFLLLLFYDYSSNYKSTNSTVTKFFIILIAFLLSLNFNTLIIKIRIFIYAINYLEFIPETRKFITHYSIKYNVIAYFVNLIGIILFFIYIKNYLVCGLILVLQIIVLCIYPSIFNYFYKEKKRIMGLWDIPKVISYF